MNEWRSFNKGNWSETIDVRDFIQRNYTPYTGDESFLSEASERTKVLRAQMDELLRRERENGGVLDIDTERVSSLLSYPAGYIDR